MNKLLLSIALFFTFKLASAQSELVVYSGDKSKDFFNFKPYSYNGLAVKDTLIALKDTALYLSGKALNYFAGGFGNTRYNSTGKNILISSVYKGDFAKTRIGFDAITTTPSTTINIHLFKNTDGTAIPYERWEYAFDLCPTMPCPTSFSAQLSDFRAIDENYMPKGPKMLASDFDKVLGIQFNIIVTTNGGAGSTSILFDNLVLSDKDVITSLDESAQISSNEEISVFDGMGMFVANGKLNELNLESGKLYIVKSGIKARKVIIN